MDNGSKEIRLADFIGEATYYEKKERLEERRPKSWLKSISAFANGGGGLLIFGVTDDDQRVGLAHASVAAEKISQAIQSCLDPKPDFTLHIHSEDGKEFVVLNVKNGKETPYYYVGDGARIAYIRVGNESIPASVSELNKLVMRGMNVTYDSLISDSTIDSQTFTWLRSELYPGSNRELTTTDFISLGLATDKGMLTNAGLLLADRCPLRHSRVFCTRWNGLDMTSGLMEALDDKELSGSLLYLLHYGLDFIKVHTTKRWKKTPTARLEMPDYPEEAYKEALVNALIHRDYTVLGSEVHIDMYDDRLEIYSPGGMLDLSLIQNCNTDDIASQRRNPVIADLFSRMHLMERRGSGLKNIKKQYRTAVNYRPELEPRFMSDRSSFRVKLYNLNYNVPLDRPVDHQQLVSYHSNDSISGRLGPCLREHQMAFEGIKVVLTGDMVGIEPRLEAVYRSLDRLNDVDHRNLAKRLWEEMGWRRVFGVQDAAECLSIFSADSEELLTEMTEVGLLEPVGCCNGEYQFRYGEST